jgi:hypothetical protein
MRTYNQEVRQYFKDVPDGEASNATARGSVRSACLIDANDSRIEAYMKMHTFRYVVQRVHERPNVYGIPIDDLEEQISFSPIVHLYFQQDAQAVPAGKDPVRRMISFRIPNKNNQNLTPPEANRLAVKIKNEFALSNGYRYDTGKIRAVYRYHPKYPNMTALVMRESNGREIVQKALSVIDLTLDEEFLTFHKPEKASVNNPIGSDLIYGKQRQKPRWRPQAVVRFQYASLHVQGVRNGIILVDRSARFINALERA